MNRHNEPDPRFHAWLAERAPRSAPEGLLQRAMKEVDQVTQEGRWLTGWPVLRFASQIGAVAAVLVLAIGAALVFSMLQPPVGGPDVTPTPSVEATPSLKPSQTLTPSSSPVAMISGPATCENKIDGFSVAVPDGWYTNDAGYGLPACMLFSAEPFAITDPTVLPDVPIVLSVLPNGDFGFTDAEILEGSDLTIGGLPAQRFVTDTAAGRGLTYVVGLDGSLPSETNEGRLLIARTLAHHDSYERDSAALDVITAGFEPTRTPSPAAEAIQVVTCEHPSGAYEVVLPEGWWTNSAFEDDELGPIDTCRFFAPSEFDVTSGDRDNPVPEGTAIRIVYIDNGCVGYINPILTSRETTIDGFPATVLELASGKEETNPPHAYEYVVDLTPGIECESGGRYVYAITTRDLAGDYEENKATLDQLMEAIQISSP